MTDLYLATANLMMDARLVGFPLNRTSIQSASKDRSYTFAKHFRRPHLKYPTVTKNDEPFSKINVIYSVV
ncbi:hypothetical protein CQ006_15215 [Pseudomonas cedrina]|uniref:Uncharacterized protein n=1 Tax=Pseudomonas cedrina TaxID=651740 RepID=A0A2S9DNX4_PSECE|nr:hypothetical protein CLM72_10840 [Pseudomonas sp. MYb193]PRC02935.1 hypothetical protein CQ006_15215 [Pseudomonas cedrina]